MGNYEVVAPIELLHFVLDHWQNYGFIDRQCDAMEFLQVVHQLTNAPESTEQVSVCFNATPVENMMLYRSMRAGQDEGLDPASYFLPGELMGHIPILLIAGDFLQIKPANEISLADNLEELIRKSFRQKCCQPAVLKSQMCMHQPCGNQNETKRKTKTSVCLVLFLD